MLVKNKNRAEQIKLLLMMPPATLHACSLGTQPNDGLVGCSRHLPREKDAPAVRQAQAAADLASYRALGLKSTTCARGSCKVVLTVFAATSQVEALREKLDAAEEVKINDTAASAEFFSSINPFAAGLCVYVHVLAVGCAQAAIPARVLTPLAMAKDKFTKHQVGGRVRYGAHFPSPCHT